MEGGNPSSSIKLIIEKGPKEGESIEYKSNKVIKIGRVVRGNTFQIKESGISSNHISIHFDTNQWMLTDLDSSNGTFLNTQKLQPNLPTVLNDGDCIKIGELTSIIVKIGGMVVGEPVVELRRNTRRQGRSKPVFVEDIREIGLDDNNLGESVLEEGVGKRNLRGRGKKGVDTKNVVEISELGESVVEEGVGKRNLRGQGKKGVDTKNVVETVKNVEETSELGLDDKLGESVVEEGVGKRNLRGRGKKTVDTKNVVESASSQRILRSSKKVTEVPEMSKIPEETTDVVVAVEPKKTRGRKKKLLPLDVSEGTGLDEQKPAEVVPVAGRRTRRGRMAVAVEPLENVESNVVEENVNDGIETVRGNEGNEANNDPAQDQVVENLVLTEEGRDGMESVAGGSSVKGSSKVADVDKGKKVAEELETRQDGAEDSMKKTEPDSRKWDLEKMTLGDFFDYLEEQLPKQIIDESEKIIADLEEKARQCYRIRQNVKNSKVKQATN